VRIDDLRGRDWAYVPIDSEFPHGDAWRWRIVIVELLGDFLYFAIGIWIRRFWRRRFRWWWGSCCVFDGDIDRECLRDLQFAMAAEQEPQIKRRWSDSGFSRPVIQTRTGCRVRRANVRTATPTSGQRDPALEPAGEKTTLSTEDCQIARMR